MIVLVERENEVLLAHGVSFPLPMYSCLAGFVEPGETLEEAVGRERCGEEVGRRRRRHPLPGQPAVAVPALADARLPRRCGRAGDIKIDPAEIIDADWFRAEATCRLVPPPDQHRPQADRLLGRRGRVAIAGSQRM